jgi:hypothetical protein
MFVSCANIQFSLVFEGKERVYLSEERNFTRLSQGVFAIKTLQLLLLL